MNLAEIQALRADEQILETVIATVDKLFPKGKQRKKRTAATDLAQELDDFFAFEVRGQTSSGQQLATVLGTRYTLRDLRLGDGRIEAIARLITAKRELKNCQTIEGRVASVILDLLGVDPQKLNPEAELEGDLGCDSELLPELLEQIADLCECEIPEEVASTFTTIQSIVDYLDGVES